MAVTGAEGEVLRAKGPARTLQLFASITISMSRPINTGRGCKISAAFGEFRDDIATLLTYRNTGCVYVSTINKGAGL